MFANWNSKNVALYNDNGQIIRKFSAQADVVNAIISGSGQNTTIAITTKNGKTELYKSNGQLIRKV